MLKVVFDTNIIVSALITPKGTTGSLFKFTNKNQSPCGKATGNSWFKYYVPGY